MKVTIIPIVIGALGTVAKGMLPGMKDSEITGLVETVHTTVLLISARIPRRVLETWGDLLHSNSNEKLSANGDVKNFKE